MKNINLISLVIILAFLPHFANSQSTFGYSDLVSESTSPQILPSGSMIFETEYMYFNTPHYLTNNISGNFRYGILNAFEFTGTYNYTFGNVNPGSYSNGDSHYFKSGSLSNLGIKAKIPTANPERFQMAVSGNIYSQERFAWLGFYSKDYHSEYNTAMDNKIIEIAFRNYLTKKINLNYSISYNQNDYEVALGSSTNLFKNFYASLDIYTKIVESYAYVDLYTYAKVSLNYEICPSLMINAATQGEIEDYYRYSQTFTFGLSWKIK